MKVDREQLLTTLESVVPGLAHKETLEQSDCFVFQDGMVRTFNEEIACSMPIKLEDVEGAVVAKSLLDALRQLEDESLTVYVDGPQLVFKGKRGTAIKQKLQAKILLPLKAIEIPTQWQEITPEYCDALLMVHECAKNKDEERPHATCVHIAKGRIEATDNETQLMRYKVKTGIKESSLIKKISAKHIAEMGAREFSETERWLHYRNDAGLVISCCRYNWGFPSEQLDKTLEVEGTPLALPKAIIEAVKIAEVYSREQKDSNFVVLSLSPGKVKLEGIGVTGEYSKPMLCDYSGENLSFMIPPKLLMQIVDKYDTVNVTPNILFVVGHRFAYASRLRDPEPIKKGKKKPKQEE